MSRLDGKYCKFCKGEQFLFSLTISEDISDSGEEEFCGHVCGSCWDAIAQIARLVVQLEMKNRGKKYDE